MGQSPTRTFVLVGVHGVKWEWGLVCVCMCARVHARFVVYSLKRTSTAFTNFSKRAVMGNQSPLFKRYKVQTDLLRIVSVVPFFPSLGSLSPGVMVGGVGSVTPQTSPAQD